MAPTQIDLSLQSLLPATSNLPAELITLAQSLLSQSKIKAAHLKPEEEVGRTYACCHIAAERLKNKHGFEVGKARPPVPPRVYGKLKGFLEGVLAAPTTPKGRSGRSDDVGGSGRGVKKTPESAPTSMRKRWAEARRPAPSVAREAQKGWEGGVGLQAPEYAMPMIRHLCKVCDVDKAAPHVYTGVSVVLKEYGKSDEAGMGTPSSGRKRKRAAVDEGGFTVTEDDVPGVVLALFITVVRSMYGAEKLMDSEHLLAVEGYAADQKRGLPVAAREAGYFLDALTRFDLTDGDRAGKWTKMEWFGNVPDATIPSSAADDVHDDDGDEEMHDVTPPRRRPAKTPLRRKEKHGKLEDEYDVGRAGLLPGLGTMFQPAVDWLSDEKVMEFERWKREMGREIAVIEGKG